MRPATEALELRDVDAGYGDRTVLQGLSARIPLGRTTVVLGPGASGKSTLLRVLEGSTDGCLWHTGQVPRLDAWRLPQQPRDHTIDSTSSEQNLAESIAHQAGLSPFFLIRMGYIVAAEPSMLLLDEPDAGAGDRDLQGLTRVLRELGAQERTIVLVTRNLAFAQSVADHVLLLEDGHKLDEGPLRRIQSDPACERARSFMTLGG